MKNKELKYFDRRTILKLISKWSCCSRQFKVDFPIPKIGGYKWQMHHLYTTFKKDTSLKQFISIIKMDSVCKLLGDEVSGKMIIKDLFNYEFTEEQLEQVFGSFLDLSQSFYYPDGTKIISDEKL